MNRTISSPLLCYTTRPQCHFALSLYVRLLMMILLCLFFCYIKPSEISSENIPLALHICHPARGCTNNMPLRGGKLTQSKALRARYGSTKVSEHHEEHSKVLLVSPGRKKALQEAELVCFYPVIQRWPAFTWQDRSRNSMWLSGLVLMYSMHTCVQGHLVKNFYSCHNKAKSPIRATLDCSCESLQ